MLDLTDILSTTYSLSKVNSTCLLKSDTLSKKPLKDSLKSCSRFEASTADAKDVNYTLIAKHMRRSLV